MPCGLCKEIYSELPCQGPTVYSSGLTLKDAIYSTYDFEYCRHLITVHGLLLGYCPCKECLVKSMCRDKCQEYIFRVSDTKLMRGGNR